MNSAACDAMLKKAKWVKSSQANEPVSRVADTAIRERLDLIWEYAPLAAKKWDDDAEFLHQMRVATRRSAAALVTFAEFLPIEKARRMQKRLKRLRKASGEARDLDVLSDRLRSQLKEGRDELGPAIEWLCDLRSEVQQAVVDAVDHLAARDFAKKSTALCARIRWRSEGDEPTYAVAAKRLLLIEIANFSAAAEQGTNDNDALHALRIAGKQLRYTMELLAGALGDDFREQLYPRMREFQDRLGAINDHAASQKRLLHWAENAPKKLAELFRQLAAEEEQQSALQRKEFLAWWTDHRKASLLEKLLAAAT